MQKVILLHGLHMHRWAMLPLANRLSKHGFLCYCFGYYSMLHTLPQHSKRLHQWLEQHFTINESLAFVGHSLGGLVIRDFAYRYPQWKIERCVTLGTPHLSSLSAENAKKLLPFFVEKAYVSGLNGSTPKLRKDIELGSLAGNFSAGLGRLILPNSIEENDGTVFVHETKLPNATDYITLETSHTGMIFNEEVANQVAFFLKYAKFNKN